MCARDFDDLRQRRDHGYGYSEKISKYLIGNTLFKVVQFNQLIEKLQKVLK